jgi:hypothetical protein
MNGIDPYAAAVSDVYQDLVGEGSFAGKGIYEIDAFEASLAGRVPDSTLLSHDLLEGIFARAGLASDIEVVEEFPARYDVEGEQAAHDAKRELPQRRVCYACCAVLESETMTARGRTCLYLSREANVNGSYFLAGDARRGYSYDYKLSNWPGSAAFRLLGRVRESHGYGFGRRYDVRTFRFVGPDGYVWSGRNAGDMQLARCKRTKQRHPAPQPTVHA